MRFRNINHCFSTMSCIHRRRISKPSIRGQPSRLHQGQSFIVSNMTHAAFQCRLVDKESVTSLLLLALTSFCLCGCQHRGKLQKRYRPSSCLPCSHSHRICCRVHACTARKGTPGSNGRRVVDCHNTLSAVTLRESTCYV